MEDTINLNSPLIAISFPIIIEWFYVEDNFLYLELRMHSNFVRPSFFINWYQILCSYILEPMKIERTTSTISTIYSQDSLKRSSLLNNCVGVEILDLFSFNTLYPSKSTRKEGIYI